MHCGNDETEESTDFVHNMKNELQFDDGKHH